jgi:type II secretory pathway component PulF
MKYKYQAKTAEGEDQVGFVEAANRDAAATLLANHRLFVLSVQEIGQANFLEKLARYFSRPKRKDLVIFTRQMAVLLEARLPLTDVLKTLYNQTNQPALKEAVFQISEDVDAGLSLSQALERQTNIFSDFFVSMVRSAEVTGNLEKVVGFLADYIEKEAILLSKARSALIYPALIVGLFVVVAFIMVTVVFPQIGPVFEQAGVNLPWFTKILISSGSFVGQWWLAFLFMGIAVMVVLVEYFSSAEGRALWDDVKVRTPILKTIYGPLTVVRLSNTMSMLLRGGIPMAQALEIVGETLDNALYRDILREISQDVREGERLATAIGKYPAYFPPLVSQMVAVGETTGQVDQIFTRIADFYGRETDAVIGNLVELIQPVLMIGIGILVGVLFASILLPLYQLTSAIH